VAEVIARSVGEAWVKAVRLAMGSKNTNEVCPLITTIEKDKANAEWDDELLRRKVNTLLRRARRQPVEHVASTIFVKSLWRAGMPKEEYFSRYLKIVPKLRRFRQNRKGVYLERLIDYPGDKSGNGLNQLEKIIDFYNSGTRRRSAFQATPYVPEKDLTGQPYLHFPCLQQVAFIPSSNADLTVLAFYPVHYLFQRAYGNYLGLVHLGEFMADSMGLALRRVICMAGVAKLEDQTAALVSRFLRSFAAHVPE
jgi:hypothetical protein